MPLVGVPVLRILCRKGEVGDELAVDHHDLVVRAGILRVDHGRHPLIRQKIRRRIIVRAVVFIHYDLTLYATRVSVKPRLGHRRRGEGIGLHHEAAFGSA
jgi:hypothetical protein